MAAEQSNSPAWLWRPPLSVSEHVVRYFHRPGWSGEKRTRQVLPPSQNPSTSFVSPSGDVKTTRNEASCNAFEYSTLLRNVVSKRPHLEMIALSPAAAALGNPTGKSRRHNTVSRDHVKPLFRII